MNDSKYEKAVEILANVEESLHTLREEHNKDHGIVEVPTKLLDSVIAGFNELEEWYDEVCNNLSVYLCEATNGLLSKSNYTANTMIQHTDEAYADRYKEIIQEEKAEAWLEGFCRGEVSGGREIPINPHVENPYA